MALSPSDVEQKTFSTALRGYDLDEVDDFLDEVVATIRDLNDQIDSGATAPEAVPKHALAGEPSPPADESAVGRALIAAQEAADRIVAEAREEAERIVAEARSEADTLVSEKERRQAEAEAEMAELAEHVAGVRSKLAVLATTVADRLDEMDVVISSQPGSSTESEEVPETEDEAEDVVVDAVEEFTLDEGDDDVYGSDDVEGAEAEEEHDDEDSDDEGSWS